MRSGGQPDRLLVAVACVWGLVVVAGLYALWRYERGAGVGAAPPGTWPADSPLARTADRATLVMLAHPRCPCSRASLEALNGIVARVRDRITAHVLFFKPSEFADTWARTDLWQTAAGLPDVRVRTDEDGREASRFGAATSGQVLLYDTDGGLRFSGGITPSRGHAGDSAGVEAILALVDGRGAPVTASPVFGCSLRDPETPHAF
jgi:hypothetical protein